MEKEEAYECLSAKVREIIGSIVPEAKVKLKILFFAEYEGSRLEESAPVCSDEEGELTFL